MGKAHNSRFLGALGFLCFLGFLGFLGSPNPVLALLACGVLWSGLANEPKKLAQKHLYRKSLTRAKRANLKAKLRFAQSI